MIEFTIQLQNDGLKFEPVSSASELTFFLPPTARIGRFKKDRDVVHLAPVPIHCFFNAITLGHWLAHRHGMSEIDAFVAYTLHDMFKPLLEVEPRSGGRRWLHSFEVFDHLLRDFAKLRLDDSAKVFAICRNHHQGSLGWKEAVRHESDLEAGIEAPEIIRHTWDWPMIGLTIRLQSSLSNALAISYLKSLFIDSYKEAIRTEYANVFNHFDSIRYEYDFINPSTPSGDVKRDIEALGRQSEVHLDEDTLVVHSFVGAHGPYWQPKQKTAVSLPFWLLLTLRQDPVSVLFPVPTLCGTGGEPCDNPAFVNQVRASFH